MDVKWIFGLIIALYGIRYWHVKLCRVWMEGVGWVRYTGRFTLVFSDFNVGKGASVVPTRHLENLASNEQKDF